MLEKQEAQEQDLKVEDGVIFVMAVHITVAGMAIIQMASQYNVIETHV